MTLTRLVAYSAVPMLLAVACFSEPHVWFVGVIALVVEAFVLARFFDQRRRRAAGDSRPPAVPVGLASELRGSDRDEPAKRPESASARTHG